MLYTMQNRKCTNLLKLIDILLIIYFIIIDLLVNMENVKTNVIISSVVLEQDVYLENVYVPQG